VSESTWDPTVRRTTHERHDARGDDDRGYRISRMTYDDDQPGDWYVSGWPAFRTPTTQRRKLERHTHCESLESARELCQQWEDELAARQATA
jgi:hypothetical protein